VGVQNPLRIDDENEPQPDLVLYDRVVVGRHPTPAETFLVVEVADASLGYDQRSKIPVYAVAGIKEVWIVDLIRNCIHTYRDPGSGSRDYVTVSLFDRLTWISPSDFPDIRVRLAELL
jgi:Uma2 family endonuclease